MSLRPFVAFVASPRAASTRSSSASRCAPLRVAVPRPRTAEGERRRARARVERDGCDERRE